MNALNTLLPLRLASHPDRHALFGLSIDSHLGASLHFFFYDVPKVITLLLVISFLVGTLQTFLQPEQVRYWLGKRRTLVANALAATVGIFTPFCSCSAVPLFIGFLEAGVPLGVTFSYLISAPMVNEVAVVLLWGLFGLKVTAIYIGFGVLLAIATGYLIGLLKLEAWVEPFVWEIKHKHQAVAGATTLPKMTWPERFEQGWYQSSEIVKSVWIYIVLGIAIGAAIHGYVPSDLITRWAGAGNPLAVPLAVMLGRAPLCQHCRGAAHYRSASGQGYAHGDGAGLHDGSHGTVAARNGDSAQGAETPTAGQLCGYSHRRHHQPGLSV
jgi:uncharacterized membrane protein YraQ (UPF0718 family)